MSEIIESLKKYGRESGKIAVLIRHGERGEFPQNDFGNGVPITKRGMIEAENFGRDISEMKVANIYTSPILRCVQTAECIVKGLGRDVAIIKENMLGNPGFHISDSERAGKSYMTYGGIGIFERFANGEKMDGIATADYLETCARQWICERCSENGLSIFVTHDVLIAHFVFANKLRRYSRNHWVDFLDGIIVDFSKED